MIAKSNLPEARFAKAEADLQAAELLLNIEEPLVEIVCYHAQQCAEKYLKGYLIARKVSFRFVHELAYLTRLCTEQDLSFSTLLGLAAELQDYATSVRYPNDEMEPLALADAERAIDCARQIRSFVIKSL